MVQYAGVKSRKVKKALKKLEKKGLIEFREDGRHAAVIDPMGKKYPIPLSHLEVNRFILKGLVDSSVERNVCTEEDFRSLL